MYTADWTPLLCPEANTTLFIDNAHPVLSHVWLCDPMDCSLPGSSVHRILQARYTRVGCHFLLQGIFPTRGRPQGKFRRKGTKSACRLLMLVWWYRWIMRIFTYFPKNCGMHTQWRDAITCWVDSVWSEAGWPGGLIPTRPLRAVDREEPGVRRYLRGAARGQRWKKIGAYLLCIPLQFYMQWAFMVYSDRFHSGKGKNF